jgi:hypothetical protein
LAALSRQNNGQAQKNEEAVRAAQSLRFIRGLFRALYGEHPIFFEEVFVMKMTEEKLNPMLIIDIGRARRLYDEGKNAEEIAAMDSLESVKDYQADRKLIYENLRLFMPFYTYEQIVKDGNKVDPSHVLNKKTVLAVYPMDDRGNRIVR